MRYDPLGVVMEMGECVIARWRDVPKLVSLNDDAGQVSPPVDHAEDIDPF